MILIVDKLLITVYNGCTNIKEENIMSKDTNDKIVVEQPEWSIPMFWEDITAIFLGFLELLRSIFR